MKREIANLSLKVGVFVGGGTLLVAVSILILGGSRSFERQNRYEAHFPVVDGLIAGSKVTLNGLRVGNVDAVEFAPASRDIVARISIPRRYAEFIREDSTAEIATQGLLGDKFVSVTAGSPDKPALPSGSELRTTSAGGLSRLITKSDDFMTSVSSVLASLDRILKSLERQDRADRIFGELATVSSELSAATRKVNRELEGLALKDTIASVRATFTRLDSILEKVNSGTGTLGALVNDPGLYDEMRSLMGGANRNRVVRNLVRQTLKSGDKTEGEER